MARMRPLPLVEREAKPLARAPTGIAFNGHTDEQVSHPAPMPDPAVARARASAFAALFRVRLGIARKTRPQGEPGNRATCMMPRSNFGWDWQCKTRGIERITIEEKG
jgi:hypothetical protein